MRQPLLLKTNLGKHEIIAERKATMAKFSGRLVMVHEHWSLVACLLTCPLCRPGVARITRGDDRIAKARPEAKSSGRPAF